MIPGPRETYFEVEGQSDDKKKKEEAINCSV